MPTNRRNLSVPALAGLLMTVAPVLFSSVLAYYVVNNETAVVGFGLAQWALTLLVCCLTSALALTPPTLLALVFGYFLGWRALLPLLVLNMAAIWLVNWVVHRLDQDRLLRWVRQNPKAAAVLDRIQARELLVIFFAKLSPVLPFALTNLVFALSGARLRNVLLGGFLGMVPRTALAVWTGAQAREIRALLANPNADNRTQVVILVLLIVSVIGLFWVLSRALREPKTTT